MKRTKLAERQLPRYTRGEERMNMITHIVGGGIAVLAAAACVIKTAVGVDPLAIVCAAVYSLALVGVYAMSSIYHGLRPGMGKKVMQVLDHCTIYFLIAGTYTVLSLSALRQVSPVLVKFLVNCRPIL